MKVCEDMIPEYYNKNLLGSVVDQQIFNSLVSSNLSNIYNHLEKVMIYYLVFIINIYSWGYLLI